MLAWGQTKEHLLHWMQTFGSQIGTSSAIRRFSHFVVPTGQVPSTGKADTGSRSPLPAIITAVTRQTKSGAPSGSFPLTPHPSPPRGEGRVRGEGGLTGSGTAKRREDGRAT